MNALTSRSTATEDQIARTAAFIKVAPRNTYELRRLGISHPAGRVKNLIERGYVISSDRITTTDPDGYTHNGVALYTLEREPGEAPKPEAPEPSEDQLKAMWADGVALYEAQGLPNADARAHLGWLVKRFGNAITVQAVSKTIADKPADALSFVLAICRTLAACTKPESRQ